jgi:hypothetical protein
MSLLPQPRQTIASPPLVALGTARNSTPSVAAIAICVSVFKLLSSVLYSQHPILGQKARFLGLSKIGTGDITYFNR